MIYMEHGITAQTHPAEHLAATLAKA